MTSSQQESLNPALIPYAAPEEVRNLIANMGRTEDVKFSPDSRWMAIAGFGRNRIYLLAVRALSRNGAKVIEISQAVSIRSDCLAHPHGIAFLGADYLVVANRSGYVDILPLPPEKQRHGEIEVKPAATISGDAHFRVDSPGSVAILDLDEKTHRILVCNNYQHLVSAHRLTLGSDIEILDEGPLMRIGLDIPDGICISPDRKWIAVSNHSMGSAYLYDLDRSVAMTSKPYAVLKGIVCPHALEFSSDGNTLFVCDSASPYMHLYHAQGNWRSMKQPSKSIPMLDDETFQQGRLNAQEGGLKGLHIDYPNNLLAVTSQFNPLAFYDVDELLSAMSCDVKDEIREMCWMRDKEMGRTSPKALLKNAVRAVRGL